MAADDLPKVLGLLDVKFISTTSIKDTSLAMHCFLPGLKSGYFTPEVPSNLLPSPPPPTSTDLVQEVAIIAESHKTLITSPAFATTDLKQESMAMKVSTAPVNDEQQKPVSYRFLDSSGQSSAPQSSPPLLPTRDYYLTHPLPSKEEIHRQFRRLDLFGEGRLTYLNLKSALELIQEETSFRGEEVDDLAIRAWLRDNDGNSKGFVDFKDFVAIYPTRKSTFQQSHSQMTDRSRHGGSVVDSDRIDRIRRAFQKYDVNGDGLIDVEDLSKTFRATGKTVEQEEIREWVRRRDSKGIGAVGFEDFLAHFA